MAREQSTQNQQVDEDLPRRKFLRATAGVAAAATLAGCSTSVEDSDSNPENVPAPEPSEELLHEGGWKQVGASQRRLFEEQYLGGRVSVVADAHALQYEDAALRGAVKERTLGHLDAPLSVFSASRIATSPNHRDLPAGIGSDKIIDVIRSTAEDEFTDRLEKQPQLSNVRITGDEEISTADGSETTLTKFAADFHYEPMKFPVPETDETLDLDSGTLEIHGMMAVWPAGETVLVAGGAYPGMNFDESGSADLSEAIELTVDVDLGLTPDEYAEELRELVKSVQ